jgi:hypothetical protein
MKSPRGNRLPCPPEKHFERVFLHLVRHHHECPACLAKGTRFPPKETERLYAVDRKGNDLFLGLIESGKAIVRAFDECPQLRDFRPLKNELLLKEPIGDGRWTFKGYVDLLLKGKDGRGKDVIWLVDVKTCSWGWPGAKLQDPVVLAQLVLYKHFLCKKLGLDQSLVRPAYLFLKRTPREKQPPIEFHPVSAGPRTIEKALGMLTRDLAVIDRKMESGGWAPNVVHCKNSFGDLCPFIGTEHCRHGKISG